TADRGIPIYQYLQEEMGVTQEQLRKMVAAGEVSSETYFRALDKNLGGAATAATTVSSAWANLGAAQGRFGATIAGPIFRQAIPAFTALTKTVDELDAKTKPVMAGFERDLTGKYIPALLRFGSSAREGFQEFRNSDIVVTTMDRIGAVMDKVLDTGRSIAPAVSSIVSSLGKASAALGVSTWEIFLSTLEASARVLDATLVPALNVTASLMENNQGAVVALAAAWLAFKTIPSIVGRVGSAIQPVTTAAQSATRATAGLRAGVTAIRSDFTRLAPQIGVTGAAMRALGNNSSTIRGMQNAFIGSSTAAGGFARAVRVGVTPALGAMRSAGSSLAGFLGGPWGVALMAATFAVINYQKGVAAAANQNRILSDSAQRSATAHSELFKTMATGNEGEVFEKVVANMRDLRQEQQTLATTSTSRLQQSVAVLDAFGRAIGITRGETVDAAVAQDRLADSGEAVAGTLERQKISNEELGRAVSGSEAEYVKLSQRLIASGRDGEVAASWLREQRAEYQQLQEAMKRIGPVGAEISAGLQEIAGAAGDSNKKLSGLETVLRALGILETDSQAALFSTAEAVREIAEAAAKGADPIGGLGQDLLDLNDNLNPDKSNAKLLRESLIDLGGEFKNLAVSGMTGAEAYGHIEGGLKSLADMYKLPIEKVAELARQFGIVPDVVDTALVVEGGPEAYRAITELKLRLDELPDGAPKVITMFVQDEQARKALEDAGNKVELIDGKTGEIRVTAKTELFDTGVALVQQKMREVGAQVASPKILADTTTFRLEDQATKDALAALNKSTASPEVGAVIDKFLAGRDVTLAELNKIDLSTAEPDVKLLVEQALAQAKVVNEAIDQAAKPRTANIDVRWSGDLEAARRASMGGASGPVSGLAAGGRMPARSRTDDIYAVAPNGAPIAMVNGREWVINDEMSDKYDAELAAINAGTFPKLPGYQDGGRLLDFVNGRTGGAKPLTGSPYTWGGVHWGDCSGAMSAIARFAVGLAPFAARFGTATMGPALKALGFIMGRGGPGDLRFGWLNGGPGGGHTAGTLPDGTNVEMGGSYGAGMVGGRDGADSPQFTDHAYLPIGAGYSFSDPGGYPAGGRGRRSRSATTKRPEWTDKQQLDLEAAAIAVRQAEDDRTAVEEDLAKGKKNQNDLDAANKKIELAQQKVVDLQQKKDNVAAYVEDGPAPQAPRLSKAFTDAEIERLDAQL
ncbi:hypothetical protein ACFVWH_44175, partial [Rhodococcus koreensis]